MTVALLIVLGGKMKAGLLLLAEILGIKQITAAEMGSTVDALVAADKAFNDSRSAQQAAYDAFHEKDDALTAWLTKARSVLTTFFGTRWSTQWAQAGFINPTSAIPSTIGDRLALALRLIAFFAANPSYEAPTLGVTAAAGTVLRDAVVSTQQAVQAASTDLKQKGMERSVAADALVSLMRLLIGVLSEVLGANDPRWQAFGLAIPAMLATPGQTQGVTVAPNPAQSAGNVAAGATGSVLVQWTATARATRYRVRIRIVGLETTYRLAASTTEPMAIINDLPLDLPVEIITQAVNGDRQGVASEPVVYQPMAKPAVEKPAKADSVLEAVNIAANGKGSGAQSSNGHRNGVRA